MHNTADRRVLEDQARYFIEVQLDLGKDPDPVAVKLQRSNSVKRRLVTDVANAALAHGLATGLDVEGFYEIAGQGVNIIDGVEYGLTACLSP